MTWKRDSLKLIAASLTIAIVIIILGTLVVYSIPTPVMGSSIVISVEPSLGIDNFSTSYLTASLDSQGINSGPFPFTFFALKGDHPLNPFSYAIISMESSGIKNLTVSMYPNSSLDLPSSVFAGRNLSFSFGSSKQLPFEELSTYDKTGSFSAVSGTSLMNGSFDPPSNYVKGGFYNQFGFYLNMTDYIHNSSGTYGTGSFIVSGTGGSSIFHFCPNSSDEFFTLDSTRINVTSPYVMVGYVSSFDFNIHFMGYSQIPNYAINYLQIHSAYPPYSSVTLSSFDTTVFSSNGGQESINGTVRICPYGSVINITTPIQPTNYIVVNAPSSYVYENGKSIYTTLTYKVGESGRIVSSLVLGALIGITIDPVFKRVFKRKKDDR